MRVSQNMIYDQAVRNMNSLLSDMVRCNEQYATQKKVNRPSDDPGGMALALDLRSQMAVMDQYQENISTAQGWLSLADAQLVQASTVTIRLEELCEQASTGTLTAEQRDMIAKEARELQEELVTVANTEYAGDSIFGGSKLDGSAYTLGLSATVREGGAGNASVLRVTGGAESTQYVEFLDDGVVGADSIRYRYSEDGGATWKEDTLEAGETTLDLGTARAEMEAGSTVTASPEPGGGGGTAIWIRPAAFYHGDDEEGAETLQYGASSVTAQSTGVFEDSVAIRVDNDSVLASSIEYSYSLDSGSTWVSGNITSNATFDVPGGHVTLASNGGSAVSSGDQFLVKPHTADIELNIGPSSTVQINNVGKIFSAVCTRLQAKPTPRPPTRTTPEENLFETIGEFIGYLETNDQEGISQCLEDLRTSQEQLTTAAGDVGGREVRLEFAQAGVILVKESATAQVSSIEDADPAVLATELSKIQAIYEAVLSTSSKVMGLSLYDYL